MNRSCETDTFRSKVQTVQAVQNVRFKDGHALLCLGRAWSARYFWHIWRGRAPYV